MKLEHTSEGNMSSGLDLGSLRAKPSPMKMWEGQMRETRIKKKEVDKKGDRKEEGRWEEKVKKGRESREGRKWREEREKTLKNIEHCICRSHKAKFNTY